ncbi:MAG TPA: hypothetical protein ENN13_01645 [Candidatus Altiarchaeales archaeon]|nr:hypothetical protein [Candidatus Altiarchaeales archaeon]
MDKALLVGMLGGLLYGLFFSFSGDAGWIKTLTTLTMLGFGGGALMSPFYSLEKGLRARNLALAFLMGFIPNTIFLCVIGSDNMPAAFGFGAGIFTVISAAAIAVSGK